MQVVDKLRREEKNEGAEKSKAEGRRKGLVGVAKFHNIYTYRKLIGPKRILQERQLCLNDKDDGVLYNDNRAESKSTEHKPKRMLVKLQHHTWSRMTPLWILFHVVANPEPNVKDQNESNLPSYHSLCHPHGSSTFLSLQQRQSSLCCPGVVWSNAAVCYTYPHCV